MGADRLLARSLVVQWLAGVALAAWVSPRAFAGNDRPRHLELGMAVLLGGLVAAAPLIMAVKQPGRSLTRYVMAAGQALMAALLIHLSGGRVESHFLVFCSLALLVAYRSVGVLMLAAGLLVLDHLVRGAFWPRSLYGVDPVESWRWAEHAAWITFAVVFLALAARRSLRELERVAARDARRSAAKQATEALVLQRTAELERTQMQLIAAAKLESVGLLAAGVAHEVKNPLGIILMGSSFLRQRMPHMDARCAQILSDIDDAVGRADTVVRELLEFASPRELNLQPGRLTEVIARSLQLAKNDLLAARVKVELGPLEELPQVAFDEQKLSQVFLNLIVNACHAMPSGGVLSIHSSTSTARVGLPLVGRRQGDVFPPGQTLAMLHICDTGHGIPETQLPHVFDPFFSTKTADKGTGLGLSVVQRILGLHGATISLSNRSEGGACASLTFPALTGATTHVTQTDPARRRRDRTDPSPALQPGGVR